MLGAAYPLGCRLFCGACALFGVLWEKNLTLPWLCLAVILVVPATALVCLTSKAADCH